MDSDPEKWSAPGIPERDLTPWHPLVGLLHRVGWPDGTEAPESGASPFGHDGQVTIASVCRWIFRKLPSRMTDQPSG